MLNWESSSKCFHQEEGSSRGILQELWNFFETSLTALTRTATIAMVLVRTHRCQDCQYQHIKITTSTQLHPVYASA